MPGKLGMRRKHPFPRKSSLWRKSLLLFLFPSLLSTLPKDQLICLGLFVVGFFSFCSVNYTFKPKVWDKNRAFR